jgi:hypothetical protein
MKKYYQYVLSENKEYVVQIKTGLKEFEENKLTAFQASLFLKTLLEKGKVTLEDLLL